MLLSVYKSSSETSAAFMPKVSFPEAPQGLPKAFFFAKSR